MKNYLMGENCIKTISDRSNAVGMLLRMQPDLLPFIHNCYLRFKKEVVVGFTIGATVGSILVSGFEVIVELTCRRFTDCDVECNKVVVCVAMEDPSCDVSVGNSTSFLLLGNTTILANVVKFRVFAALDDSLLISLQVDTKFRVAPGDFTHGVTLNDATLGAEVF